MTALSSLINEVAQHLKKSNWQLVTAESCTGGLIASAITEVSGSSDWFERGFVTYSNLSKEQMLGVPHELIAEFGAVSEEVADAMAIGALLYSAGQISLAVTGIAGPLGGSKEKPVGTVCFSWAVQGRKPQSLKKHFSGTRQDIRQAAVQQALEGVLILISSVENGIRNT